MPHNGIRMVCFDAGGVLVRICRSWHEGCERSGVPFRWNAEAEAMEPDRRDLNDRYQRGLLTCDEFFAGMAGVCGGLYTAEEIRTVHEGWIIEEYPGVRGLIGQLNDREDLTTGLLSNTSASHWSQGLMHGGLGVSAVGRVHHPHASHVLGLLKPSEAIYRAFERATGFQGAEILFFDDLPENVAAAAGAGWTARLIDYRTDTAAQIAGALREFGLE